ncbi:uncharacterized BrkB/YihY/UPF0761 family membrane protein [Actinoplanes teichomyceticus]|uniref:Uncharacterized BrkB/YihY/UPF0761 family membrane protein n=1 Tax=Actinoplanes teichomyceticus TaxID=1867 RepID=A0A561WK94_ACTTI|nr:uncharacterized BrkB/YihY/UPF0761 family membrane protein [Actinoplanes teichomyceticus]
MPVVIRRLDGWQRRHRAVAFGYAVLRKYLDDGGTREAALITYYGFLSLFPTLLLGVTIMSRVLPRRPELRRELFDAIVPPVLRPGVEAGLAALPTSRAAWLIGLAGLAVAGAGVVLSAYRTLNHLAAVPYRQRSGLVSRYLRVLAALAVVLAGAVVVAVAALPQLSFAGGWAASCVAAYAVLVLVTRLLLDRPAPMRALWPAALPGAVGITLVLQLGAALMPGLIRRAGPIYGGFATVAAAFTVLYLLSNLLVCAAEAAAVRQAALWPRGLDPGDPTPADVRARQLLIREQERGPGRAAPGAASAAGRRRTPRFIRRG